jgi:hypothetical protein
MGSKHSSSSAISAKPKSLASLAQSNPPLYKAHLRRSLAQNKQTPGTNQEGFKPMDFASEHHADRSISTKEHSKGYLEEEAPKTTLVCFPDEEGTSKTKDPTFLHEAPTSAAAHLQTDTIPAHYGPLGGR